MTLRDRLQVKATQFIQHSERIQVVFMALPRHIRIGPLSGIWATSTLLGEKTYIYRRFHSVVAVADALCPGGSSALPATGAPGPPAWYPGLNPAAGMTPFTLPAGSASSAGFPSPGPVVHPLDRAGAAAAVDAVFAGLSPRSRYLRFHAPMPRLPAAVRARLVDVDGTRHAAVVAEVDGPDGPEPVGLAQVLGAGHGTADVAVAVVDAWQRRGIGKQLLADVAALAEEIGYTELRGTVLPENVAMQRLARSVLPWIRPWFDGEAVQFVAPIGPAAWTVTHEDLLADLDC